MKRKSLRNKYNVTAVIILIILILYTVSILAMYIWAFFASLKTQVEFSQSVISLPKGWPWEWAWDNYYRAAVEIKVDVKTPDYNGYVYLPTMLFNSVLYSLGGALVNNLTTWITAYTVARFGKYKFSKVLYTLNIVFMSIPIIGNLPSALAVYKTLGWYDNYIYILTNNIGFVGIYFLIYHSFICGLGKEFYESAYMDGAGHFTVMTKIALPLTFSMFMVVLLLLTIVRWNDYMTMVIWMPNHPTLAYGIYKSSVSNSTVLSFPNLQIAVCMVLMLPMLILFAIFQKPMMSNLRLGAVKG